MKSSYRIDIRHANASGSYTCSPAGNSSHSTVILRLACDRHSNDTTSHPSVAPLFFPAFSASPRETDMCTNEKHPDMKPFANVRASSARSNKIQNYNCRPLSWLQGSGTLRRSKEQPARVPLGSLRTYGSGYSSDKKFLTLGRERGAHNTMRERVTTSVSLIYRISKSPKFLGGCLA